MSASSLLASYVVLFRVAGIIVVCYLDLIVSVRLPCGRALRSLSITSRGEYSASTEWIDRETPKRTDDYRHPFNLCSYLHQWAPLRATGKFQSMVRPAF